VDAVAAPCGESFPGRGREVSGLWRAKQLEYTWLLGLMERYEDFWHVTERSLDYACRRLDLPCPPATRAVLMNAYLELPLYPDVSVVFDDLRGHSLSILSNGSPAMLDAVIRHNKLQTIFHNVISVDEVRTYKPSPRVYALAANRLRAQPQEITVVSANAFDVIGAKRAGCRTIWLNRTGSPWDELGGAPDAIVKTFAEVPGALPDLGV
jgi:2-haloacid dehalogenase